MTRGAHAVNQVSGMRSATAGALWTAQPQDADNHQQPAWQEKRRSSLPTLPLFPLSRPTKAVRTAG